MNRQPYLILLLTITVLLVLIGWGIYSKLHEPPKPMPTPATQPLVERLKAERERRIQERAAATTTSPSSPAHP